MGITRNADRILTGSGDKHSVGLWNLLLEEPIAELEIHRGGRCPIYCSAAIAIDPDAEFICLSRPGTPTIEFWGPELKRMKFRLVGHGTGAGGELARIRQLAISDDGKRIASVSHDATARVWQTESPQFVYSCRGLFGSPGRAATMTGDGQLGIVGNEGRLRVWDLSTGDPLRTFPQIKYSTALAAKDGSEAFVGDRNGIIRAVCLDTGTIRWEIKAHEAPVSRLEVSGDGSRVVSVSRSGDSWEVCGWEGKTGMLLFRKPTAAKVDILSLCRTGNRLALGQRTIGTEGWIEVWDTDAGMEKQIALRDVWSFAISPDGQQLAMGVSSTLQVLELETEEVRHFRGHDGVITSVGFSIDQKRLVSSGSDNVRVWSMSAEECLLTIPTSDLQFQQLVMSPDGKRVAGRGMNVDFEVWDTRRDVMLEAWRSRRLREKALPAITEHYERLVEVEHVVSALARQEGLSSTESSYAVNLAMALGELTANELSTVAKRLALRPHAPDDEYRRALTLTTRAMQERVVPENKYGAWVRALAQYRLGLYADAISTIEKHRETHPSLYVAPYVAGKAGEGLPYSTPYQDSLLIVHAMALYRLGEKDAGAQLLEAVLTDASRWPDPQMLLQEARTLILHQ